MQSVKGFLYSAAVSPCVRPLQPRYGHIEDTVSSVDLQSVPPLFDSLSLPLRLNKNIVSGADSFTKVHVVVFGVAVCGPAGGAEDGDFSSNMAAHLQQR